MLHIEKLKSGTKLPKSTVLLGPEHDSDSLTSLKVIVSALLREKPLDILRCRPKFDWL